MRTLVRFITLLLGLALALAGALLIIELLWALTRPGVGYLLVPWPSAQETLGTVSWNDPPVRATAAGVAVLGLLLVLAGARAGRKDIHLHDPAPGVTVVTAPRSLARFVGHHVRQQEGIASASVTASRRKVRVNAVGEFTETEETGNRLSETATESLRDLPLPRQPKVSVSLRPAKER